jgi:DNA polymerase-3 subunit delta'
MIIWLAEKMHISCSNKLLKLIEEPPSKTLFILVSENEESLISTIRSRAQLIKIPFIDSGPLKKALIEKEGADEDLAAEAVHLANGSYVKALEYLDPGDDAQFYLLKFQEMMRYAYTRNVLELINWAEEMAQIGRDRQKLFFDAALRLVREYFIFNLKKMNMVFLNREETNWGKQFAPFINERNIIPISQEFELGIKHIAMNGNPRIVFLDTALRMVRQIKR